MRLTLFVKIVMFLSGINQLFAATSPIHFCYIQPKPNSEFISPATQLTLKIFKNKDIELSANQFQIKVIGEKSGLHPGKIVISDNTIIFKPNVFFQTNEKVSVKIEPVSENLLFELLEYSFQTNSCFPMDFKREASETDKSAIDDSKAKVATYGQMTVINGVAVPGDFPVFQPSIIKDGIAPGKIFLNNWIGSPYIMIFENDGTPYFYQRVEDRARDFKVQPNGMLTRRILSNLNCFVGLDSNYAIVDTFRCANGYGTDEHEIYMLEDGHYFLIALGYRRVDMSILVPGGNPNTTITDNHVQEFDENGNLVFEWLSYDYFNITDAVHENLTGNSIDYIHMNSIAVDYDGHIIISSRHLSEVTKINRQTGEIIWRLGGENNQFEFVNDEYQNSYQHYARPVPGQPNHYTVFDNGNQHSPQFSRAVEFIVDTTTMKAYKSWEYRHTPDRYTYWMGNAQRLANGNTFINWADGSLPKATEVTPNGEVVYEADFLEYSHCYRAFRFEWESVVDRPYLQIESLSDKVTLIFNKFGDKNVQKYIIYGGKSQNEMVPLDSTANTWLELSNGLENNSTYHFKVRALSNDGIYSAFSDIETTYVSFSNPGSNMIENSSFSQGDNNWIFLSRDEAEATGVVEDGEFLVNISAGGAEYWKVQLTQENIPIIRGRKYLLEFDARADANRAIEPRVAQNGGSYTNYSKTNPMLITRQMQSYSIEFEMTDPTDYSARLVLNCGNSEINVYFDNISVSEILPSDIQVQDQIVINKFQLFPNYPNPFNSQTMIRYAVPEKSQVTITIFNILGEKVFGLFDVIQEVGEHSFLFDGSNCATGIYFVQFEAQSIHHSKHYIDVQKMVLVN